MKRNKVVLVIVGVVVGLLLVIGIPIGLYTFRSVSTETTHSTSVVSDTSSEVTKSTDSHQTDEVEALKKQIATLEKQVKDSDQPSKANESFEQDYDTILDMTEQLLQASLTNNSDNYKEELAKVESLTTKEGFEDLAPTYIGDITGRHVQSELNQNYSYVKFLRGHVAARVITFAHVSTKYEDTEWMTAPIMYDMEFVQRDKEWKLYRLDSVGTVNYIPEEFYKESR
jgi:hypothetical protein